MATATNAIASVNDEQRDEYGRTSSERTVELSSRDAEIINREVEAGKHDTYDEALSYIIERGAAEIKRTRDAAVKAANARLLVAKKANWKNVLTQNPELAIDPKIVATMLKDLGLTS